VWKPELELIEMIRLLLRWLVYPMALIMLACCIPFAILWLLVDYKTVRANAEIIAPLDDEATYGLLDHVCMAVALPLIVFVNLFLLSRDVEPTGYGSNL
jgi:hypothetical protein